MMLASGVRGRVRDAARCALPVSSLPRAPDCLGELMFGLCVPAAGRVSLRRASHFLCWWDRPRPGFRPGGRVTFFAGAKKVTKESTSNTISLAAPARCAPARCRDAHRAHERALHQRWWPDEKNSCASFSDFERAHARDSIPVPPHGAQRPWPASQIVFNVLSWVTFFARAKKVTRPPGRHPAGGSHAQQDDQFAKAAQASGSLTGEGTSAC